MESVDYLQGACESSGIVGKMFSVPAFSTREIRLLAVEPIKKNLHTTKIYTF